MFREMNVEGLAHCQPARALSITDFDFSTVRGHFHLFSIENDFFFSIFAWKCLGYLCVCRTVDNKLKLSIHFSYSFSYFLVSMLALMTAAGRNWFRLLCHSYCFFSVLFRHKTICLCWFTLRLWNGRFEPKALCWNSWTQCFFACFECVMCTNTHTSLNASIYLSLIHTPLLPSDWKRRREKTYWWWILLDYCHFFFSFFLCVLELGISTSFACRHLLFVSKCHLISEHGLHLLFFFFVFLFFAFSFRSCQIVRAHHSHWSWLS